MQEPRTIIDKIWDAHVVQYLDNFPAPKTQKPTSPQPLCQLYIDRLYAHEVTSPQAFAGLAARGLGCFRPSQIFCMPDHNTPTHDQDKPITEPVSRHQVDTLTQNASRFGLSYWGMMHPNNGIIHVVGPEQGLSLPGMTIVCGDSHTSTHGAVGAIAFGIGTSEVEMVMASQCILQNKPRTMRITIDGQLGSCVTAKDLALFLMSRLTTSGATGHFVEYAGEAIRSLSMEGRLTLCNLSIEMGARGGLIAPDDVTFDYLKDRPYAPKGVAWDEAVERWRALATDPDAHFDKEVRFDAADITPMITYGTNPGMGIAVDATIPEAANLSDEKALHYMQFAAGEKMLGRPVDYVFLGACTNGRIEDFRAFASVVRGRHKASGVTAWLVPGSWPVMRQIEAEGIDRTLKDAGFEIRQPGCSACLAMNDDKIPAGKLCVSTSNRNFEGRQGPGARTCLASPFTAAAAAVTGVVADPRTLLGATPTNLYAPASKEILSVQPTTATAQAEAFDIVATAAPAAQREAHQKFGVLESTCVPLPLENVDTDQIIPARFLKATDKAGFGENLFRDWRYAPDGTKKDFVLNDPTYSGNILVAGKNFGCGSSREHAAWAIAGYGFRVVISSFFADIHKQNELNNFVLPVTVSEAFLAELFDSIKADPSTKVRVDLPARCVTNLATMRSECIDISDYKKYCFENGLDDVDFLLENKQKTETYETQHCSTCR